MPSPIVRTLKVGDIIEIVRHDKNCRMHLRRVRVRSVVTKDYHYIVGENLHGELAREYRLPLESWPDIIREPNNIGWFPFVEDAEFDG